MLASADVASPLPGGTSLLPSTEMDGVQFPEDEDGKRSSSSFGRRILAAAMDSVDPERARTVLKEKRWRTGYEEHVLDNLEQMAISSPEQALQMARDGLAMATSSMEFTWKSGRITPLLAALHDDTKTPLYTAVLRGRSSSQPRPPFVPFKSSPFNDAPFENLSGHHLEQQLAEWAGRCAQTWHGHVHKNRHAHVYRHVCRHAY